MELKLRDGKGTTMRPSTRTAAAADAACCGPIFARVSLLFDPLRVCHTHRDRPNKYQSATTTSSIGGNRQRQQRCQRLYHPATAVLC